MPATPTPSAPLPWKPLVVCPHPAIGNRLLSVFRELSLEAPSPLTDYPRMGQVVGIARQVGCDICFLDVLTNPEHAQQLITELSPTIPVVALHTSVEADLILRCLRRGACEFLTDPTADALRNLFARLARARAPGSQRTPGAIYAVIPGKGGSGASTVAAHLAVRFGLEKASVLLVDGDSLCGSISFLLKIKSDFHLGDILRDWQRIDQDLWKRFTTRTCGIDVVAAPSSPVSRIEVHPMDAAELCAFWRDRYDVVILDLADARAAADTGFAAMADAVLLVAANELGSLQATRRAIDYLDKPLSGRSRLRLILNRCTTKSGLKREDVLGALGVDPYTTLGEDWAGLQIALLDGDPVAPSSRFATGILSLARQLQKSQAPASKTVAEKDKKNNSWFSLLRHRSQAV